jgi:hypothetical protein
MTNQWSPPYTLPDLRGLFGLQPEDIIMLAEVGLLRSDDRDGRGRFQVYGLGNRYLVGDLLLHAEAAHRLQGSTVPADCENFVERSYVADMLRAVFRE